MSSRFTRSVILFVCLLSCACNANKSSEVVEFSAWENNPILKPGPPGSWDNLGVWAPQIIFNQDTIYLFYMGIQPPWNIGVGLATSTDGYNFSKFANNPVLARGDHGFDTETVGPGIVVKTDSVWLMYYNSQNVCNYAPGRNIGRAVAKSITGPWIKNEKPVISAGSKGEWDAGFILPSAILLMDDGTLIMYYTAGEDIALWNNFYIGMATSEDGMSWQKYNDPETIHPPFALSDPVMKNGKPGEWDAAIVWMANVQKTRDGFLMYYTGSKENVGNAIGGIGYATSSDGIRWKKHEGNPVFHRDRDPFVKTSANAYLENASVLFLDTICLMYYDCGPFDIETYYIGMATGKRKSISYFNLE